MPENDFEIKVQDKMDGLDIQPSAAVWEKVEYRIRKEKKRRFIFWWPLGLLLIGAGVGLIVWLENDKRDTNDNKTTAVLQNDHVPYSPASSQTNEQTTERNTTEPKVAQTKNLIPVSREKQPIIERTVSHAPKSKTTRQNKISFLPHSDTKETVKAITDAVEPEKATDGIQSTTGIKPAEEPSSQSEEKNNQQVDITGQILKPATDSANKLSETMANAAPTIKIKPPVAWGIGVSIGNSSITQPWGQKEAIFLSGPPGNPPPVAQLAEYRRPSSNGSWSFGLELFRKKTLTPRVDLITSAGYQYYSTKGVTGERVDSIRVITNNYSVNHRVSKFYRLPGNGISNRYANQFHLLKLNAEISWRISGKKSNIRWNNGLGYGRLLGTSQLFYDVNLAGYYTDRKRVNGNYIFFQSALSFPVKSRFFIIPYFSYSFNSVVKSGAGYASGGRFSDFAVRFRYLLDQKK